MLRLIQWLIVWLQLVLLTIGATLIPIILVRANKKLDWLQWGATWTLVTIIWFFALWIALRRTSSPPR